MNIFVRSVFITFDVDYHDKNALINLNFCMAMKHHPIALWKTGLINSIVADVRSKTKSVKLNIDAVRELIMLDCHVTYSEIELSLAFLPLTYI